MTSTQTSTNIGMRKVHKQVQGGGRAGHLFKKPQTSTGLYRAAYCYGGCNGTDSGGLVSALRHGNLYTGTMVVPGLYGKGEKQWKSRSSIPVKTVNGWQIPAVVKTNAAQYGTNGLCSDGI